MLSYNLPRWTGKIGTVGAMVAFLAVGGCKNLDVPNYTSADADLLETAPDASVVNLMTQGLFSSIRGTQQTLETYGRNFYNLDPTEVRSVTVPLIGPIASGGYWPYSSIRNGYSILHALDKVPDAAVTPTGMTALQKNGVRGFTKTIMAYHYMTMIRVRYGLGGFIDVDRDKFGPLAPWVNGKAVLDHTLTLLDEAYADLAPASAGTAFSFTFTRGFQTAQAGAVFNTPATFRQFNRALKARMEVYAATWDAPANANAHWNAALTALGLTWINAAATTVAQLDVGPKHTYGPTATDGNNGDLDATGRQRFVHPSVVNDAQLKVPGAATCDQAAYTAGNCDNRMTRKIIDMGSFKGILGLSSRWRWNIAATGSGTTGTGASDTPFPIIRNEELILLRAEANVGLGNNSAAIADINVVRTVSGQLTPILDPYAPVGTQPPNLLEELLYEKRYSLLYEGHRWVDLVRYNRLLPSQNADPKTGLVRDAATHRIWPSLPFDTGECDYRRDETLPAGACPLGGEGGI